MFYIKYHNRKVPIEDPFYTTCPMCGTEHVADLVDIIMQTDGDLENLQVYCERCTEKRALARAGAHRGKEMQTHG